MGRALVHYIEPVLPLGKPFDTLDEQVTIGLLGKVFIRGKIGVAENDQPRLPLRDHTRIGIGSDGHSQRYGTAQIELWIKFDFAPFSRHRRQVALAPTALMR